MTMANSTESASRIPVTLRRSSSLRQKGERCYGKSSEQQQLHRDRDQQQLFPAISENADARPAPPRRSSSSLSLQQTPSPHLRRAGPRRGIEDSDLDSLRSFGSNCSNLSAASTPACEHAHFALNGTTWSARSRRYVVHCSPGARGAETSSPCAGACESPEQYLTPTQRSARQLRQLQTQLREVRRELDEREREVARLNRELVELRLLKAAGDSPTAATETETAGAPDRPPSLVDSGHFEEGPAGHFERRIDEMQRRHLDELQRLKQEQHERLESVLGQLAELASRQHQCEARPGLEQALEQSRSREQQLQTELDEMREQLRRNHELLADREERNKRAYLEVYAQGRQAAKIEQQSQSAPDQTTGDGKVSVAELLQQLTVTRAELDNVKPLQESCAQAPQQLTLACRSQSLLSLQEAVSLWVLGTRKAMYRRILESTNKQNALDPEITLQFLKSAIYYFLTDRENLHGHLNAIESILGFTETEKLNIDRIYRSAKK